MTHWTEEHDRILIEQLSKGVPGAQIAREMGRSKSAIYHRAYRLGKSRPTKINQITTNKETIQNVIALYDQGFRYTEISKRLKISVGNISHIINKNVEIKRSKRQITDFGAYSNEIVEHIGILRAQKLSLKAIAKRLGIRYGTVSAICFKHGFKRSLQWTAEQTQQMRTMLESGSSLVEVSKALHRTAKAVWLRCNHLNIHKTFPHISEEIRKLYHGGNLKRIIRQRLVSIRHHDKKKGRDHNLDAAYVEQIYTNQGGKCFYTGRAMTFDTHHPCVVSIDRLDSSLGHVKGNVVLCCSIVNSMKQHLPVQDFIDASIEIAARKDIIEDRINRRQEISADLSCH